jgi:hypothetical protein
VPPIAAWVPEADVATRHEILLPVAPERALELALGTPAVPDLLVRGLFVLRGLARIRERTLGALFPELERSSTEAVFGFSAAPWKPTAGVRPFAEASPNTVRIAFGLRAEPAAEGSRLVTETRVAAVDEHARRAFLRYWRLVGPFSGVVRRRWLGAVRRRAVAIR